MTENERGPSPGPSHVNSDRSVQPIGSTRRQPHRFLFTRGDDELLEAVFYANSEAEAGQLAFVWASKRGWTVEGSA